MELLIELYWVTTKNESTESLKSSNKRLIWDDNLKNIIRSDRNIPKHGNRTKKEEEAASNYLTMLPRGIDRQERTAKD